VQEMVIVAVKKKCLKKGRRYGPYPKDPDTWYLYRVYRSGDRVVSRYLGKGPRLQGGVVQENNCRKCDGFEDELLKREMDSSSDETKTGQTFGKRKASAEKCLKP